VAPLPRKLPRMAALFPGAHDFLSRIRTDLTLP
jgi:hypothetical protein